MFDIIQTFFVDPDAVQGAPTVLITAVDLFFKKKPNNTMNSSGITNPGVNISLCEVENDLPILTKEFASIARREYNEVFAVSDSSIATTFGFSQPIPVQTGRFYGIIVRFDDNNFEPWINKFGHKLVGTNSPSGGSTQNRDGNVFYGTNSTLVPQTDVDLKYRVRIARYTDTDIDVPLVNDAYEFLTLENRSDVFVGGENIFVAESLVTGTINVQAGNTVVIGTGTTLTAVNQGQKIIIKSGNTYSVATVAGVANTSRMELVSPVPVTNTAAVFYFGAVAQLASFDYVSGKAVLTGSTANSTVNFLGGDTVRGERSNTTAEITSVDNIAVDEFISHVNVVSQSLSSVIPTYSLAQANGAGYLVSNTFLNLPENQNISVGTTGRFILSRSNEVAEDYLYSDEAKSAVINLNLSSNNDFIAPYISDTEADIIVRQMVVSNTTSHIVATIDTEIGNNGKSSAKHLTKKITFEADRQAEDLRVFASAYRPVGTEVRVYAKFHNSEDEESFDDKLWTPLEIKNGRTDIRSSLANDADYIEYEFGVPAYPESSETLAGSFTVIDNNATITGLNTADLTTKVVAGSLIKLWSPLFPTNYVIGRVVSRTSTTITLAEVVTNDNVVGSGMTVDVLKYATAFSNGSNSKILRYYNNNGSAFDKYNTVQVKVVLQADASNIVPKVDQIEVIGVSA